MARNDENDNLDDEVDPSEGDGPNALASAPEQQQQGGGGEKDKDRKKDEPGQAGKGINPVQHSE